MSAAQHRIRSEKARAEISGAWPLVSGKLKPVLRVLILLLVLYAVFVAFIYFRQRSMLYFPSHDAEEAGRKLVPWRDGLRIIGYCHEVTNPATIWLMTHGNAGQAADRDYVLQCLSNQDSLYVLEYPGYGAREGSPSRESMNRATAEAYRLLRSRYQRTPVCALGESIGTGPASFLATEKPPPDKIVLMVPFDSLSNVASRHFPFLPVRLLLRDAWDNVESLRHYTGPVEVFGATDDSVIPVKHARALAAQVKGAKFTLLKCRHTEWADCAEVKIRRGE
jgi:pimeloyl-ACP methyl ester carboxylesterase